MANAPQPPYGGTVFRRGSSGPDVALIQRWLNGIRTRLPAIGALTVDGSYGAATQKAVETFQLLTGLPADGSVGSSTWAKLSDEYTALFGPGEIYPGVSLRTGSSGATVKSAQQRLQTSVPSLSADGVYGAGTKAAVTAYQTTHGLAADGVLGRRTWSSLYGQTGG